MVHSPVAWRNKTEIDVLAVRFPKNAEPERGVGAAEELVAADGVIDIVIGEVKSRGRQLQFNEALRQSCDTSRTPGGSTPVPLRTCWSIWAWKILKQRAQRHERARLNAHVIPMSPFWVQLTGANDYAPTANSDIVVVTAGFPRKPGMSRDDLLWANYEIVKASVEQAVKYSPECILMVVTNPLDAMCHVAYHVSGFPKHRVVGMARVLDTARFRTFVAQALNVSASDVVAFVLGGHGDTMAPLVRYSSVAGIPLADLMDADTLQGIEKIYEAKLTKDELVALHKSAAAVKELVDVMAPKLA